MFSWVQPSCRASSSIAAIVVTDVLTVTAVGRANYGDFLLFTALELAISSFTAAIDESEYPVSMRRPPRHRRDRPRHSRAGRPRRVVEQGAENEGRGTQCPVDGSTS